MFAHHSKGPQSNPSTQSPEAVQQAAATASSSNDSIHRLTPDTLSRIHTVVNTRWPEWPRLWFRNKRQLWTYSGLAVETHDSAEYRYVDGQLQRSKKPQQVRGLNQNHNHAMKEIFKSAALNATLRAGPFQDFYEGLLARGMKPELARVTLARKIAAITLTLWKKGECFDAGYVKRQAV